MLTSRGIALQGVGFGPLAMALQGFVAAVITPPNPPSGAAGGYAIVGRLKKDPFEEEEALLMAGAI